MRRLNHARRSNLNLAGDAPRAERGRRLESSAVASATELRSFVRLSSAVLGYFDIAPGISLTLPTTQFVNALYSSRSVCLEASGALAQFLGVSRVDDLIGRPLSELFCRAHHWQTAFAEWQQRGFTSQGFEVELRSRLGTPWTAQCVLYARNHRGRLRRLWIVARDVSHHAQAVRALAALQEHYQSILNAPDTICARLLPDGVCEYVSPATISLLGVYTYSSVSSRVRLCDFAHPADQDFFREIFSEGRPNRISPNGMAIRFKLRDGSFAGFIARRYAVFSADGRMISCDIIATRAERIQSTSHAAFQPVDLVAATPQIAHDLNNLLTIGMANLHVASTKFAHDSPLDAALQTIVESIRLTRQLFQDSPNAHPLGDASVWLPAVLNAIIQLVRPAISPNVTVSLVGEIPDVIVAGTSLDYIQMLTNLILNASEAVGGAGKITLTASSQAVVPALALGAPWTHQATITVSDNGPGIPEETKHSLFMPGQSTKSSGRGFGLASVRRVLSKLGGDLDVESISGHGAAFTLHVPASYKSPHPPPRGSLSPTPRHLRVMATDDEPAIRLMYESAIPSCGHHVEVFSSAPDLLQRLSSPTGAPDVVFIDDQMPGSSASQLARAVRDIAASCTIVVASGNPGAGREIIGHEGDIRFLAKPFMITEIRSLLDQLAHERPPSPDSE